MSCSITVFLCFSFDEYKYLPFFRAIQYATLYLHPKIYLRSITMPSFSRKPKPDQGVERSQDSQPKSEKGDKGSQDSPSTPNDKEKSVSPSRSMQEEQTKQVRPRPMRFAPSIEWNERNTRENLLDRSRRSLNGFVDFFKEDEIMVDKCGYCNNYCRRLPNGQNYCDHCAKNGFL